MARATRSYTNIGRSSQKDNNLICNWHCIYRCVPEKSLDRKYSTYGIYTCCTKIYNSFDRRYAISYKETLHTISRDSLRVRAHLLSPWVFIISEFLAKMRTRIITPKDIAFAFPSHSRKPDWRKIFYKKRGRRWWLFHHARFTVANLMPPSIRSGEKKK